VKVAKESNEKITELFHPYLVKGEFAGGRYGAQYPQMNFSRVRRYTNYKGGKYYNQR
jgi:hypothetical protein